MSLMNKVKDVIRRITGEVPTSTLIERGLKVGTDFNRQQGCFIDPTHCFLIEIGNNVTMSIRVTLMAHDASTKKITGYTKIGKIKIGDNVFIGANATVLPNVVIGNNAIIGANSVVTKDVPEGVVVAGYPARVICTVEEYEEKNLIKMNETKVFGKEYRFTSNMDENKKQEMIDAVENGISYID